MLAKNDENKQNIKYVFSTLDGRPTNISWVAGVIFFSVLVDYLLALAGVDGIPKFCINIDISPLAMNARGNAINALAGLIGGIVAVGTFYLTHRQKQTFHDEQLKNINKNAEEQLKIQRAQAEYDAIASEYDALSKDFVSSEELSRINAAIGLAKIAQRVNRIERLDFRAKTGNENKEPPKTRDFYPWYEPISMQLTAAILKYDSRLSRDAVANAITIIAKHDVTP